MASAFTHAVVAVAAGKAVTRSKQKPRFWVLSIFCSVMPDFDAVGFWLGVPYGHVFGHRGLTHSLAFALVIGLCCSLFFLRERRFLSWAWWKMLLYFGVITASHGLLDAVTNGGLGIGFLLPFDETRYFFPWRPVQVAPISISAFFSEWGLRVMLSEIVWIWCPAILLSVLVRGTRRWLHRRRAQSSNAAHRSSEQGN